MPNAIKTHTGLEALRDRLYLIIMKILIPIGLLVGLYNTYTAFVHHQYPLILIESLAFLIVVGLLFVKGISVRLKRQIFTITLYGLCVFLMVYLGDEGPGILWLLGLSILVTCLTDEALGYYSIAFNIILLLVLYVLTYFDLVFVPGYAERDYVYFTLLMANYLLISIISVHSVAHLLRGMAEQNRAIYHMHLDLKQRENELTTMYKSISEGVISLDANQCILSMNERAEYLTGYVLKEAVGKVIDEIYLVEREKDVVEVGGQTFVKAHLTHKQGHRLNIEERVTRLETNPHQHSKIIVFRDMTDYRKIENELRQAYKLQAVGQLAGGIAHDFNNMLAGILGYAELIELQSHDNEKLNRYAKAIIATSNRASDLTSQLLSFARHDLRERQVFDLNHVTEEGVNLLKHTLHKTTKIITKCYPEALPVCGDSAQLVSAIINMGINAKDAMPFGGHLIIRTDCVSLDTQFCTQSNFNIEPGRYAMISIEDEGEGIPKAIQERIFEPFFTTKEVGKGTGLGLSVVYGVVKAHGGAIKVTSALNKGTEFRVYLPLNQPITDTVRPGVLLIDDDSVMGDILKNMLQFMACDVTHKTALNNDFSDLTNLTIKLVLFNVSNDFETVALDVEALRAYNPMIPIVLVISTLDEKQQEVLSQMDINGCLTQPFSMATLKQLLHQLDIIIPKGDDNHG